MKRLDVRQTCKKLSKYRLIWFALIVLFVIGLFVLLVELLKGRGTQVKDLLPCSYLESIDITDGERQSDGSIKFNNITYPKEFYAVVDFIIKYDENGKPFNEKVKPYYRGCVCNKTNCMFVCYTGDGAENCKASVSNEAIRQELDQEFQSNIHYFNGKPCNIDHHSPLNESSYKIVNVMTSWIEYQESNT